MFSSKTRHLIVVLLSLGLAMSAAATMKYSGFTRIGLAFGVFGLSWIVLGIASGIILGLMGHDLRRK